MLCSILCRESRRVKFRVVVLAVFVSLAAVVLPAAADVVVMRNGDWLSGKVVTMDAGELLLETEYAGAVVLDWDKVARVILDRPLPVALADGSKRKVLELPDLEVGLAEVAAIAPPPPAPIEWRGRVDFGWANASGNRSTELGTLTAFAERTDPDRYRLSVMLDAAKGSSDGEDTANRARAEGKYDRRAGDGDYRYYLAGLGYDRVRSMDSRLELGTGVGRMLIDRPGHLLTAELGASYVRDDFAAGETQSDAKLRVGEAWQRQLGEGTGLRQSLSLLAATDEWGDYTAEFVLALTHRLSERLALTSRIVNSYDSRPAPGTERSDFTFATQVGVTFGD